MSEKQAHEKVSESDIYIGNQLDKANPGNPLYKKLISNFDNALLNSLSSVSPKTLHEVGCGEGRLSVMIQETLDISIRASDFSQQLIEENLQKNHPNIQYLQKSIYDLDPNEDAADMVVCCEVLEHLEDPDKGLKQLARLDAKHYLLSVPREPIWRILNMVRFKYLSGWGNTPGHLNHWSKTSFIKWLESHGFLVIKEYHPFPWSMVLVRINRD